VEEAHAARRHLHHHARASNRARIFAVFAPLVSGRARLGTCHISKRHLEYHTSRDMTPPEARSPTLTS
jgi:hypothetical protein